MDESTCYNFVNSPTIFLESSHFSCQTPSSPSLHSSYRQPVHRKKKTENQGLCSDLVVTTEQISCFFCQDFLFLHVRIRSSRQWGCFSSIQSREQQTLLCKTGVVLVVVSCLPGFGRLSGSLTLVRQYRSSSSSSFCCEGEGQQGRQKTYLQ